MQRNFNYTEKSSTFSAIRGRLNSCHVSGDMNHKRRSLRSALFPIELNFNHCCRNVYARCTKVLAGHPSFLKDRDVLPISHHPCGLADIKLKIHIEIPGHTHRLQKFQNINKWKKHLTAWICVSRSRVHWVAFAQGVAHRGML